MAARQPRWELLRHWRTVHLLKQLPIFCSYVRPTQKNAIASTNESHGIICPIILIHYYIPEEYPGNTDTLHTTL